MTIHSTWLSSVLLGFIIFFQSACKKTPLEANGQSDNNSPWNSATYKSENDPFSQDAMAVTNNPSQEHTIKLLRETVIPQVDWPEQPLSERLQLIQQVASRIGLSVKICEAIAKSTMIYPSLCVRNTSLALAIKYTAGRTKLCYRITDTGDIYFHNTNEIISGSKGSVQDSNRPHDQQSEQGIPPNDR